MSEPISIQIKIADRNYPLKVKQADENKVKNAAEKINLQLKDLMNKYDGRDMQDYLAMYVMLQMSDVSNKAEIPISIDFNKQLQQIENGLDELLK